MSQQLNLNVARRDGHRFSSFFVTPENAELLGILKRSFERDFPQIFLWGETQAGKSHLLQAYCENYYQQGLMAAYLPLGTCAQYGVRMLFGLESKHLVVVDELDAIIGQRDWEEALTNLINTCRSRQQPLMFAARQNPREMDCVLPDFASRLLWGPVHRVHLPDQAQALQAFRWRAYQRGFEVSEAAAAYIATHFPHDIRSLMAILDRLDRQSLTTRQRITQPFIRKILRDFTLF